MVMQGTKDGTLVAKDIFTRNEFFPQTGLPVRGSYSF